MKTYLTYKDDKSDKFWQIETQGNSFTVTYGKTNTSGTSQTKTFESEEKCLKEAEKLVAEKKKKGYKPNDINQSTNDSTEEGFLKIEITNNAIDPNNNSKDWALTKLNNFTHPQSLFLGIFKNLAETEMSKAILKALAQRVTFAFAQKGTIKLTDVEHQELINDPIETELLFLAFRIYIDDNRSENLLIAPPQKNSPNFKEAFWNDFSYVEFCDCKLFGEFNTSVWENDEYILDGIEDGNLLDDLSNLPNCVIENSEHQWVVSEENGSNFWLVTGLLHADFSSDEQDETDGSEQMELELIEDMRIGEIYLRLLYANVFGQSRKLTLSRNFSLKPAPISTPLPLNLRFCKLTSVDYNWASTIPRNIRVLELYSCGLTELPEELRRLCDLEELELSYNYLTFLPDWICELTALKKLCVSCAPLTHFPEAIGKLEKLEVLECVNAKLTQLPEAIGGLTSLQILDLSRNKLSALPHTFGHLKSLKKLDLSFNKLSSVPDSFTRLLNLNKLDLKENPINFLLAFCELANLSILNLNNAGVTGIPDRINQLTRLTTIFLNNNQITRLPGSLLMLPLLEWLEISNNQIESLPDLSHASKLRVIYIASNKISQLSDALVIPQTMKEFVLRENQLNSFPVETIENSNLNYIDLSRNPISKECDAELIKLGKKVKRK